MTAERHNAPQHNLQPTKLETPETAHPEHIPACFGGGWGGGLGWQF